jgi:hypothetical protein
MTYLKVVPRFTLLTEDRLLPGFFWGGGYYNCLNTVHRNQIFDTDMVTKSYVCMLTESRCREWPSIRTRERLLTLISGDRMQTIDTQSATNETAIMGINGLHTVAENQRQ